MNRPYALGGLQMSATGPTPAIEIRGLTKRYGGHVALDDVSLAVDTGLFVTLLGPSGCGKSTLLRAIAGFVTPDRGSVRVAGRDITAEVPHRRPVSMVFQDYALFPHMTVMGNVGFGCEMQGMSRAAVERRSAEMLSLIRLPDIGDRRPDQLSGGQRQRVALARALAPDPVSLLLDEPLGALDLKLRLEMQRELKSIQRRTGKTFIFVTHDQDEALSMSDMVAVMRAGRIEQLDTPDRVYARPATTFVAGFVGAANMLPATVVNSDGRQIVIEIAGDSWTLPAAAATSAGRLRPGQAVTAVVRPEAIRIGGTPPPGAFSWRASVIERTFFGGRVHLRLQAGETVLVAEARPRECAEISETVAIHCEGEDVAVIAEE